MFSSQHTTGKFVCKLQTPSRNYFSFIFQLLMLPILLLLFTQTSNAEVLFDHSATATTGNTQGGLNSLTIPAFNVPATLTANARILLVGVSIREPDDVAAGSFRTVASVTYGNQSFTKLAAVNRVGTPTNIRQVRVELWFLQAPVINTADVVVTLQAGETAIFTTGVSLYYCLDTNETGISFRPQNCPAPSGDPETAQGVTVTEFNDFGQGNNIADLHMTVLPDDMVVSVIGSDSTANPQLVGTQEGFIPHQEFYSAFTSFGNAGGRITSGGFPVPAGANPCERTGWKTTGAMPYAMIGVVLICTTGPTEAKVESFKAMQKDRQVKLNWQTAAEVNNLGYNIYRETNGIRSRINRELIAGSALKVGSNIKLKSGNAYTWFDQLPKKSQKASYWIEEVDLSGESTWHGPMTPTADTSNRPFITKENEALLLSQLAAKASAATNAGRSYQIENKANVVELSAANLSAGQVSLAGKSAVKISVNREGWYRVTQPQLVAAGLNPNVEAKWLQLYADGQEQAIAVTSGAGGLFDASSSIEFYGQGLDTTATDTHVYWLVVGNTSGLRISKQKSLGQPSAFKNFTYTAELKERTVYFAGLINGEANNFFGAIVSPTAVNQVIPLQHIDFSSTAQAVLAVNLQGVSELAHRVRVQLNGNTVGEINFNGQGVGSNQFILPHSAFLDGENTVTLFAANGSNDISLVDNIRVTYQHKFIADNDALKLSLTNNDRITIGGFTSSAIRVFDITNANEVQELTGTIGGFNKNFSITVAPRQSGQRTLLALTNAQAQNPANLAANNISNWAASTNSADLIILSHRDFFTAAETLKAARQSEGYRTALVDIEDVYDEFSYGNKSPQAVRNFLSLAKTNWLTAPRFVLLMGDASYDPRDYYGLGSSDFIPTKLVGTKTFETACDDWFVDFNEDGIPDLAVGRLPVDTAAAATNLVGKIINYQTNRPSPSALLVSDANDNYNFEEASSQLIPLLQDQLSIEEIRRGQFTDPNVAKAQLLAAINSSKGFVNYVGHGSIGLWRGSILTTTDALALTNTRHSVFVSTTCLNAYYHDPLSLSLGQALLESAGGAIAVWSSSSLNTPEEQSFINGEFYRQLFGTSSNLTIGEAAARAKLIIQNKELRQTYILLGDPTMKVR